MISDHSKIQHDRSCLTMAERREYPNDRTPAFSSEEVKDEKLVAVKKQKIAPIALPDLDDGPLQNILGYLDAVSLARAECVCNSLREIIAPLWDQLVEKMLPPRGRGYDLWTAKERLFRWIKASSYAKRMERVASCHFHYDVDDRSVIRCAGCSTMPDLDRKVWAFRLEPSEIFIRLSYRVKNNGAELLDSEDRVVCQGFIPRTSRSHWKLSFDLLNIYNGEDVQWPEMHELLELRDTNLEAFEELFRGRVSEKVKKCFGNLSLTVATVRQVLPWHCSLVVATGGFVNTSIDSNGCKAHFQPRCVRSHGTDRLRESPCFSTIQFCKDSLALILWRGMLIMAGG